PRPDARVSAPLTWEELDECRPEDFTLRTMPGRFAAIGDRHAQIDEHPRSLEPLLELSARQEAEGLGDAPWPPHYAKQPGDPTPRPPSRAAGTATSLRHPSEDLGELGGRSDLELIVAAVRRPFVGTPAHEGGRMPEAGALQVVVLHLADALDPERLPGEVLALAPAAGGARHPSPSLPGAGPLPPRVRHEGVLAQRSELLREPPSRRHRERRGHAH